MSDGKLFLKFIFIFTIYEELVVGIDTVFVIAVVVAVGAVGMLAACGDDADVTGVVVDKFCRFCWRAIACMYLFLDSSNSRTRDLAC